MKKSQSLLIVTAILAASTLGATSALAESYVGFMLGPSFVSNNGGTDFDIGGHIGTEVLPGFSLGLYGTHESLGSNNFVSASETTLAVEGNIHPIGSDWIYVGAKAGLGITSASFFGTSGSETDFVFGPAAGFNLPLLPGFLSVGAEANVLFLEASSSVTFVNILGTVTLHF